MSTVYAVLLWLSPLACHALCTPATAALASSTSPLYSSKHGGLPLHTCAYVCRLLHAAGADGLTDSELAAKLASPPPAATGPCTSGPCAADGARSAAAEPAPGGSGVPEPGAAGVGDPNLGSDPKQAPALLRLLRAAGLARRVPAYTGWATVAPEHYALYLVDPPAPAPNPNPNPILSGPGSAPAAAQPTPGPALLAAQALMAGGGGTPGAAQAASSQTSTGSAVSVLLAQGGAATAEPGIAPLTAPSNTLAGSAVGRLLAGGGGAAATAAAVGGLRARLALQQPVCVPRLATLAGQSAGLSDPIPMPGAAAEAQTVRALAPVAPVVPAATAAAAASVVMAAGPMAAASPVVSADTRADVPPGRTVGVGAGGPAAAGRAGERALLLPWRDHKGRLIEGLWQCLVHRALSVVVRHPGAFPSSA